MATKTTKRALILSVISLFVCFTMLIGTTYAWFTDSVTSSGNIIKTGTLDVTLEYKTPNDSDWIDASTGAIFNHVNWEPGYTEVRYVKVENEGSLDLKFMLSIIPSEKTADNEPNLADVIDVYIAKTAVSVDRNLTDLILVGTLSDLINDPDGAAYGVLYDKDEAGADTADEKVCVETYTLVLKMQETAGNEYQNRTVGGTFAVQLLATQLASESDDLGNDYDAEATYPDVVIDNTKKEEDKAAQVATQDENGNDEVVVDIPEGAPAGNYSLEVTDKQEITDANGNTTIYMDITLKKDGAKVTVDPNGNVFYTVSVNIGAGVNFNKLVHAGEEITDFDYDIVTGIVTFTVDSFSPFEFRYDEVGAEVEDVESVKDAVVTGGLITLTDDITLDEILYISESTIINGNGHKIISTANRVIRVTTSDIKVVLNDVNMVSNAAVVYPNDIRGISIDGSLQNVDLTLNDCSVEFTDDSACDGSFAVNVSANGTGHKVTVSGGTYEGGNVININGTKNTVVVKNATINSIYSAGDWYGACIWVKQHAESSVEAVGNVYSGENVIAYNVGYTPLVENGNTDNTGVVVLSGNYGYQSLAEAIEKASDGATLYFVKDIESVDGVVITDKNLTIDLDGHTYTVSEGASTNNRNFKINGTSVVTIKNGTLVAEGELTSGAYGTVRTEDSANVTLEGLKLYSYRGYGLNIKALSGTTVTINDCEIYAQYSGGIEAAGGTIELTNVKIEQNGVYSGAAWCSVAIGVNGGGKVVVNSGTYSAKTIETDANAAKGTWVAYVMSSGGTLEINGGTFNGFVAETANAANACGVICADRAAVVDIYGGTFNSNGAILDMRNNEGTQPNPVATIYGGTFSADPTVSGLYGTNLIKVADGHIVIENADGTYSAFEGVVVSTTDELVAAINAGATKVYLNSGDYALRFTNNTNFNVDGMTLKGLGDVKLTISSTEAWYGRVQGSNVTFENIHFTSTVGATGKATYNNCTFDNWTICASINKEETYFNNCAINGCLNTSTDFSSGDVYVKNCTVVKAEYSGSMTVNFESCEIGEVIIWNSNTNFTNCDVTTMNLDNVSTATVMIDGVVAK